MKTKEERAAEQEQLHINMLENIRFSKEKIAELMNGELIDENGYPTDDALEIVKTWHWNDPRGWFDFIKSVWYMASWGWSEGETDHQYKKDEKVYQYNISTAGWSGNESIIRAMQENDMMWHLNWVQSRRGGHYVFELKEVKESN
jgi:hypothetical protein